MLTSIFLTAYSLTFYELLQEASPACCDIQYGYQHLPQNGYMKVSIT